MANIRSYHTRSATNLPFRKASYGNHPKPNSCQTTLEVSIKFLSLNKTFGSVAITQCSRGHFYSFGGSFFPLFLWIS